MAAFDQFTHSGQIQCLYSILRQKQFHIIPLRIPQVGGYCTFLCHFGPAVVCLHVIIPIHILYVEGGLAGCTGWECQSANDFCAAFFCHVLLQIRRQDEIQVIVVSVSLSIGEGDLILDFDLHLIVRISQIHRAGLSQHRQLLTVPFRYLVG